MRIAALMMAGLLAGVTSGYLAYRYGIRSCDLVLILAWFVLLPIGGMALSSSLAGRAKRAVMLHLLLLLTSPLLVLFGFRLAYLYQDAWRAGYPFALASGLACAGACWIGIRRGYGTRRRVARLAMPYLVGFLALSLVAAVVLLAYPVRTITLGSTLGHAGQGILNLKDDDWQCTARAQLQCLCHRAGDWADGREQAPPVGLEERFRPGGLGQWRIDIPVLPARPCLGPDLRNLFDDFRQLGSRRGPLLKLLRKT